jgi:hypothetical protein
MAMNFAYNFAEIDNATGMCVGVISTTNPDAEGPTLLGTTYVVIPVYDEEYVMKYYLHGSWYEDAEGTIPWTSSLL